VLRAKKERIKRTLVQHRVLIAFLDSIKQALKLPAARYAKLGEPRKRSEEKRRAICVQKEDTSRIQEQQLVYCASLEHVNWN